MPPSPSAAPSSPPPRPVPSPPRRKRSLRCPRCSARKFRLSRDLALHILSKHGHVHVPPADDARSVTLSSPLIPAADLAELDQLLAPDAENIAPAPRSPAPDRPPPVHKHKPLRKLPLRKPHRRPAKRPWSCTASSARLVALDAAECDSPRRVLRIPSQTVDSSDLVTAEQGKPPVEGESTGPTARDVYLARCRDGRIPLVPIPPPTPAMLNFANGLF